MWGNSSGQAVGVVANRTAKTSVPSQPFGSTSGSYVRKLQKSTGSFGGGALLKVMSGDVINTSVDYFYNTTSASNNTANGLNTLVTSLLAAITGSPAVSTAAKAGASTATSSMGATGSTADIFLSGEKSSTAANQPPEAYLHVLLFNEQFVFDNVNSYVEKVATANVVKNIAKSVPVKKNGYAYIYFSNESESAVWFDNLQLTHVRGAILEETHYYPFGLTMAGISSKAAGGMINKRGFNGGNELQSGEFSDGSGLELYDAVHRMYDAQLGRFGQIDALAEVSSSTSPFAFASNNPLIYNDPLGLRDSAINESNPNILPTVYVHSTRHVAPPPINWLGWPELNGKTGEQILHGIDVQLARKRDGLPYLHYGDTSLYNRLYQADQDWRTMNYVVGGILVSPFILDGAIIVIPQIGSAVSSAVTEASEAYLEGSLRLHMESNLALNALKNKVLQGFLAATGSKIGKDIITKEISTYRQPISGSSLGKAINQILKYINKANDKVNH